MSEMSCSRQQSWNSPIIRPVDLVLDEAVWTMNYKRLIRSAIPPFFVFVGVTAFEALRHLRSLHQPVSGILVDAVGAAVLFALLSPVVDAFSERPKESRAAVKHDGDRK